MSDTAPLSGGFLSGHAHFLHWGVIQISLANLIVIVLMVIVFVIAVIAQLPHSKQGPDGAHHATGRPDAGGPDDEH